MASGRPRKFRQRTWQDTRVEDLTLIAPLRLKPSRLLHLKPQFKDQSLHLLKRQTKHLVHHLPQHRPQVQPKHHLKHQFKHKSNSQV